jgi:flagellar motility protein MotE (MotC chaperone)
MRLRLLPVLMFALVAMMTVKVGSVWNAFEISIGTATLAQGETGGEAGSQPAATPAGETATKPAEQPATPPAGEQAAAAQPAPAEGAAPKEAAGQQAATTPETPAAAPVGEQPKSGQPVSGQPMSEEEAAAAAAAAAEPEPKVEDPFDYTDEEVDVLQQLAKRREELELRARQLDEREALIQAAEQRMDQKMAELKALQATVEDLLKTRSEEEEAELKSLVKMYENMKPKAAAKVFEEMDMDVLLDVVDRMSERKVAPILALVTPTRAKEITFELAQRRQLPVPE